MIKVANLPKDAYVMHLTRSGKFLLRDDRSHRIVAEGDTFLTVRRFCARNHIRLVNDHAITIEG